MKKFLFSLIILLLLVVAACSNDEETEGNVNEEPDTTNEETNGNAETANDSETDQGGDFTISDEPLELSIHLHYGDTVVFDDGWSTIQKAAELTNVSLKGTASATASNSDEVFNLMMGSGDLPDIIHGGKDEFNQYGEEGAFVALNDLIEEHAPNLNQFLDEREDVRRFITAADGNIYFIPFIPDGEAAKGWFIRHDWLDELELEVPDTVDDYYEVLTAFKNDDPNGNGEADEIPYLSRSIGGLEDLMILWGAYDDLYRDGDQIKFGPIEEAYSTAVENLAKWYSEGLIDQEIFTRGVDSINELIGNNTGGSTHDWFGSTASVNDVHGDAIEGLHFAPFAPPTNVNGEKIEETSRATVGTQGWGISYSNEHPEESIQYFDFWFSEEGRRLANFGVEGETYNLEGGEPVFTEDVLASGDVPTHLHQYGAQVEFGFHQDFSYEEQWMNPIAKEGAQMYSENEYHAERMPELTFTEEEQDRINDLLTPIQTYVDENFQQWILGTGDVTQDYDAFRNQLLEMGAEEVVDIYQTAMDRYLNQ